MNEVDHTLVRALAQALGRTEIAPDLWQGRPDSILWSTKPATICDFTVQHEHLDPNSWETAGLITAALAPLIAADSPSDEPTSWLISDLGERGWEAEICHWDNPDPLQETHSIAPTLPYAICECALKWLNQRLRKENARLRALFAEVNENTRLRELLIEAVAHFERYGDSDGDQPFVQRLQAAIESNPEPVDSDEGVL